ncbi:MAG: zf-HC2 domain-containing protein [Oscillospiraceae bacterium]
MSKISCDVCIDLIPLVKDAVASDDSANLVKEHIETCENCKEIYNEIPDKNISMDNKIVISKIKKKTYMGIAVIAIILAFWGVGLTNTQNVFYNSIVMPLVGALSYIVLRKKTYIAAFAVIAFSYVQIVVSMIFGRLEYETVMDFYAVFISPLFWIMIYIGLFLVGVIISALLCYAFKKERKENEN